MEHRRYGGCQTVRIYATMSNVFFSAHLSLLPPLPYPPTTTTIQGYRGFYDGTPWRILSPDDVSEIHNQGGTALGSSRGGFDANKIIDACDARGINVLFIIGGDGTHRGILELVRTAAARRARIVIAGVPKTIDNDIPIIDKTFGFDTAVEKAVGPISSANVEAKAALNGIGLVKLMGRSAGFIAAHASMASQDVNLVLIPEAPWRLSKVLSWLEGRLARRGHAVIVVAEGAESEEMKAAKDEDTRSPGPSTASPAAGQAAAHGGEVRRDESGNILPDDVGQYLKDAITKHFKALANPANVKYIDPSYIIRSSAPNASDSNLCTNLAYNVVHGALAGYTGFTVGTVDNHFVMLPIAVLSVMKPKTIDLAGRFYSRLCATTGQPSCM
jgi:6-phosphofructokinase 1